MSLLGEVPSRSAHSSEGPLAEARRLELPVGFLARLLDKPLSSTALPSRQSTTRFIDGLIASLAQSNDPRKDFQSPPEDECADAVAVTGILTHLTCVGTYSRTNIPPGAKNGGRAVFKGPGGKHLFFWSDTKSWIVGDDYNSCQGWLSSAPTEKLCPSQAFGWREIFIDSEISAPLLDTIRVERVVEDDVDEKAKEAGDTKADNLAAPDEKVVEKALAEKANESGDTEADSLVAQVSILRRELQEREGEVFQLQQEQRRLHDALEQRQQQEMAAEFKLGEAVQFRYDGKWNDGIVTSISPLKARYQILPDGAGLCYPEFRKMPKALADDRSKSPCEPSGEREITFLSPDIGTACDAPRDLGRAFAAVESSIEACTPIQNQATSETSPDSDISPPWREAGDAHDVHRSASLVCSSSSELALTDVSIKRDSPPNVGESGRIRTPRRSRCDSDSSDFAEEVAKLQASVDTLKARLRQRDEQKHKLCGDLMEARRLTWEHKRAAEHARQVLREVVVGAEGESMVPEDLLQQAKGYMSDLEESDLSPQRPHSVPSSPAAADRERAAQMRKLSMREMIEDREAQLSQVCSALVEARSLASLYCRSAEERLQVVRQLELREAQQNILAATARHPAGVVNFGKILSPHEECVVGDVVDVKQNVAVQVAQFIDTYGVQTIKDPSVSGSRNIPANSLASVKEASEVAEEEDELIEAESEDGELAESEESGPQEPEIDRELEAELLDEIPSTKSVRIDTPWIKSSGRVGASTRPTSAARHSGNRNSSFQLDRNRRKAKSKLAAEGLAACLHRAMLSDGFDILREWAQAEKSRIAIRKLQEAVDRKDDLNQGVAANNVYEPRCLTDNNEDLPVGWESGWSADYNQSYYYRTFKKESTWTHPAKMEAGIDETNKGIQEVDCVSEPYQKVEGCQDEPEIAAGLGVVESALTSQVHANAGEDLEPYTELAEPLILDELPVVKSDISKGEDKVELTLLEPSIPKLGSELSLVMQPTPPPLPNALSADIQQILSELLVVKSAITEASNSGDRIQSAQNTCIREASPSVGCTSQSVALKELPALPVPPVQQTMQKSRKERRPASANATVGRREGGADSAGGSPRSESSTSPFVAKREALVREFKGASAAVSQKASGGNLIKREQLAACGVLRARLSPLLDPTEVVLKTNAVDKLKACVGAHFALICLQSKARSFHARQTLSNLRQRAEWRQPSNSVVAFDIDGAGDRGQRKLPRSRPLSSSNQEAANRPHQQSLRQYQQLISGLKDYTTDPMISSSSDGFWAADGTWNTKEMNMGYDDQRQGLDSRSHGSAQHTRSQRPACVPRLNLEQLPAEEPVDEPTMSIGVVSGGFGATLKWPNDLSALTQSSPILRSVMDSQYVPEELEQYVANHLNGLPPVCSTIVAQQCPAKIPPGRFLGGARNVAPKAARRGRAKLQRPKSCLPRSLGNVDGSVACVKDQPGPSLKLALQEKAVGRKERPKSSPLERPVVPRWPQNGGRIAKSLSNGVLEHRRAEQFLDSTKAAIAFEWPPMSVAAHGQRPQSAPHLASIRRSRPSSGNMGHMVHPLRPKRQIGLHESKQNEISSIMNRDLRSLDNHDGLALVA
mmetsp:Transcript_56402/g.89365  ORF Transcript_56402/g.89365 Transcript_56402/m.89365 type:complete len:1604 (-) Transcript_56402:79-4890(-)